MSQIEKNVNAQLNKLFGEDESDIKTAVRLSMLATKEEQDAEVARILARNQIEYDLMFKELGIEYDEDGVLVKSDPSPSPTQPPIVEELEESDRALISKFK